jgi:hypothetical protein
MSLQFQSGGNKVISLEEEMRGEVKPWGRSLLR